MLRTCVAYRDGKKLGEISVDDIRSYLDQPDCFVWVAIVDPGPQELVTMQAQFGLHPLAIEDAQKGFQRPKVEEYGDSLFAVVHMIEEKDGDLVVGEADIFVGRNYVLSVRNRAERGFQEVRARSESEPQLLRYGPGYVLYALMDAIVDRYFPILDRLDDELEALEDRIFTGTTPRENIEGIYSLKQRLMTVKHAVTPLLDAISNLSGTRVPGLCSGMQEYFRDVADHLHRLNQSIESARDTLTSVTTVNVSMISLQESEVMKRLAAYAALVAVPTMIAGIYGMNFDFMPELQWKYGYFLSLGLMVVFDGLLFWKLRKERWL